MPGAKTGGQKRAKKQRAYSKFTLEARRRGHRKALFPSLQRPGIDLHRDLSACASSPVGRFFTARRSTPNFSQRVPRLHVRRETRERERERERNREAEVRSEIRESTERGTDLTERAASSENGMILLDVGQGKYAGQ